MKPLAFCLLCACLLGLSGACTATSPAAPVSPSFAPSQTFALTLPGTQVEVAFPSDPPAGTAPIPESWLTYRDPVLRLELRYPENWRPETAARYSGADGYFELLSLPYRSSQFDSLLALCMLEANQNKPAVYGMFPYISNWQGYQHSQWAGYGCAVTPGSDWRASPEDRAVLFARYPPPWPTDTILLLRTDSAHFAGIVSTLRFVDYLTPTPMTGNYNSPACQAPLANASPEISHFAGLTVTEYPIVRADCDPWAHFDGFQARVKMLNINLWGRYASHLVRRADEANRLLEPFGYRLAGYETDFALYRGEERLMDGIDQIGPLSLNAAGDDFILWVENTDQSLAAEIRRDLLRQVDWTGIGFNTVWAGSDLIRYEYDRDHLFPVGSPSQALVYRNEELVYRLSVPQAGSAGYPVKGLWGWQGHWVLEAGNVVIQDGGILNLALGYQEIFDWHLVNGQPMYLFRQNDAYGVSYAGQSLPQRYEDVIHGQLCCDPAVYNVFASAGGVWFYALRDGIWVLVSVLVE